MRLTILAAMAVLIPGLALAQTPPADPAPAAAPATAPEQAAKPKPKPKAKPGMATLTIKIVNNRNSAVNAVGFVPQGSEEKAKNLLKAPLAPGKSRDVGLSTKKGQCLFDVQGSYADETEIEGSGLDLCKDQRLVLVD